MCGFIGLKKGTKINNSKIKLRGQDFTNIVEINNFIFVHNLLSITGEFTLQPYIKDGIVAIYNGEIYSRKFIESDGEVLIPLYLKYGYDFVKHLDGEWAIAIYDFNKGIVLFSTDFFGTKPIWVNGTECASYQSGVGGQKLKANRVMVKDLFTEKLIFTKEIHGFDFDNQYKTNYDDWIVAFERSIKKRAVPNCFIGLSSGYDSGSIACELLKQKVNFKAFIVQGKENVDILKQRMKLVNNYEYLDRSENFREELNWVKNNIEHFKYKITDESIRKDTASLALSRICRKAHKEERKVYLSGQGCDEIIADYGLNPRQSTFKGKFPEELQEWENFYEGCQYSYLGKEEYVAGSHSIETRYPFLDKDVVQEFLWLDVELKNRNYKAPLYEYLTKNKFPFEKDVKRGLSVRV